MKMRTAVILFSIVLPTLATPFRSQRPFAPAVPSEQDVLPVSSSNEDRDMIELLNKYAPVIKLSIEEGYYPSSIEFMLDHFSFIETRSGECIPANHTLLTPQSLDQLHGEDIYLSISESHNPQPFLDEDSAFLAGPAGQKGGMKRDRHGRGIVTEPVYGFWVEQGRGVLDLWYWTFYPFNFGKLVGPFGILGNHVGDWERLRMRTVNGTAVSVDYHSHNGGSFSAGTTRWSDVPKYDCRPIGYSAAGSHGLWPAPGEHVFAEVLNLFKLADITDDDGALWDTKGRVIPARYWDGSESRKPISHQGDGAWLNYRGRWGNKGVEDCWWHRILPICQVVPAPPGPNRWFGEPPDCIIAPLTIQRSTFAFYISSSAVRWAEKHEISLVQVQQVCARPRRRKDDGDDDDDVDDDDNGGDDDDSGNENVADYIHDSTKDEDLKIWTTSAMTRFIGRNQHIVSTMPCKGAKSAVKAYRISLCVEGGKFITTSGDRRICSYQDGKKGYRFGGAVVVDDLDDWRWDL